MAFPAYIGRVNVVVSSECETEVMSETAGRSSVAATRGRIDFAAEECAEKKCVYFSVPERTDLKRGVSVSGSGGLYEAEDECSTASRPCSLVFKI